MFRIHADQVRGFAAQRRAAFETEARAFVAQRLGRPVEAAFVTASVDRAIAHEVVTEPEVLQWVLIEASIGGELAREWTWAPAVLALDHLTALGKLRTLLRRAVEAGVDATAIDLVRAVAP